jgi:hypothetical protein
MLHKAIVAAFVLLLMTGAASAQMDNRGLPGYTNSLRTDQEKKNDRELDRAYQSTIKGVSVPEKKKPDPWGDVRPAPPAAAKNKQ